ncbi:MAG: hypothetical protein KAH18_06780 [Psychromonas sp.]|nr:hypothetical protein [Psychromonas sp.]
MFCLKRKPRKKIRHSYIGIEMQNLRRSPPGYIMVKFQHSPNYDFTPAQEAKLRHSVDAAIETSLVARRAALMDFENDYDKLKLWFGSSDQQTVALVKNGVLLICKELTNTAQQLTFYNVTNHNAQNAYCSSGITNTDNFFMLNVSNNHAKARDLRHQLHEENLGRSGFFRHFRGHTILGPPYVSPESAAATLALDNAHDAAAAQDTFFHEWQSTLMPDSRQKCVAGNCSHCQSYKMGLNVNVDFNILLPYTHLQEYIQVICAGASIYLVAHVTNVDEILPIRNSIDTADECQSLALTARDDAISNASNWGFFMAYFAKSVEYDGV